MLLYLWPASSNFGKEFVQRADFGRVDLNNFSDLLNDKFVDKAVSVLIFRK